VVSLVAAYGVYAASCTRGAGRRVVVDLLPALVGYALAYFVFSRLLFYFSLLLRAKLEVSERLMIIRYE